MLAGALPGLTWLLVVLLAVAPAGAENNFPLVTGSSWSYAGDLGHTETLTCVGTTDFWGEAVQVILYSDHPPNAGLENYYTSSANGDVLLWGWYRPDEEFGMRYAPPLPYTQGTLAAGAQWAVNSEVFMLPENAPAQPITGLRVVTGEGLETVPAGEFYAYALAWDFTRAPAFGRDGRSYDLMGRLRSSVRELTAPEYWVPELGRIRATHTYGEVWSLTEYSEATATALGSWGGIKALY